YWNPTEPLNHRFVRTNRLHTMSLAPGGRQMAVGLESMRPSELWDVATGMPIRQLPDDGQGVTGIQISPDGRTVALKPSNNPLLLWESGTETPPYREVAEVREGSPRFAFDREGRRLAVVSGGRLLQIVDVASARVTVSFSFSAESSWSRGVCFSPD